MKTIRLFMLIIIFILCFNVNGFSDDIVIISHKDVVQSVLTRNDVVQIFTGRQTRWDDGQKIHFAILKTGAIHQSFLKKFLKKTESQFKIYWRKVMFTGKGSIPKSFATVEELIRYVIQTEGAIGYIPAAALNDSVKQIKIN